MINLSRLRKDELLWMARHRCRHGHLYISHPACYEKEEMAEGEKVGFIDIETSNLNADFGIILSYCIKEKGGGVTGRVITPRELKSPRQDGNVVRACVEDMMRFDRLVGFYSARFDIPYIRSRAMVHGIPFPPFGTLLHTDVWFWVRGKLKLHNNRLQTACEFFDIPAKQHKLDTLRWTKALTGDIEALDYIFTHNEEDVVCLETLYDLLLPFNNLTKSKM